MELLKAIFPLSFPMRDVKSLVVTVVIYIAAGVICGLLFGLLSSFALIGFLFYILGRVSGVYILAGIILAILDFCNVFRH